MVKSISSTEVNKMICTSKARNSIDKHYNSKIIIKETFLPKILSKTTLNICLILVNKDEFSRNGVIKTDFMDGLVMFNVFDMSTFDFPTYTSGTNRVMTWIYRSIFWNDNRFIRLLLHIIVFKYAFSNERLNSMKASLLNTQVSNKYERKMGEKSCRKIGEKQRLKKNCW